MSNLTQATINQKIREMIKNKLNLNVAPVEIDDEILFGSSVGFDSTSLLEFILALEDQFDIIVPDEDLVIDNFGSITQMTDYVVKNLEQ